MQPPQALAPIAYVLDLDAQVRANPVILQRVHNKARVKVVGRYPVHKGLAHQLAPVWIAPLLLSRAGMTPSPASTKNRFGRSPVKRIVFVDYL
jgi:hypothetical protein